MPSIKKVDTTNMFHTSLFCAFDFMFLPENANKSKANGRNDSTRCGSRSSPKQAAEWYGPILLISAGPGKV